jgi:hypothetical protein
MRIKGSRPALGKNARPYLKNNESKKGLET